MGINQLLTFNRFMGDPNHSSFAENAPPPTCGNISCVGRVVSQSRTAPLSTYGGWRCFDLRTSSYDNQEKQKQSFLLRCFFPLGKRFEKTILPTSGSIVQLAGQLLGRLNGTSDSDRLLALKVEGVEYLSIRGGSGSTGSGEGANAIVGPKTPRKSAWGKSRGTPSKRTRSGTVIQVEYIF